MSKTIRVPDEFLAWLENIKQVFKEKHNFEPSASEIIKAITKQFSGKFIV